MPKRSIRFVVNGSSREVEVEPARRLVDVLRVDVGLTGSGFRAAALPAGFAEI